MTKVALSLALAVAAGCASNPNPAPAPTAPSASVEAPPDPTSGPDAETSAAPAASAAPLTGCPKHLAEYDEVLAKATSECAKDNDCLCFGDGLSRARGAECGGVVDAPTGKKLAAIQKTAQKNNCSNGSMCEPWTCVPICEGGRCQKGPRKK